MYPSYRAANVAQGINEITEGLATGNMREVRDGQNEVRTGYSNASSSVQAATYAANVSQYGNASSYGSSNCTSSYDNSGW